MSNTYSANAENSTVSPLDRPMDFSRFPDDHAFKLTRLRMSLRQFAAHIKKEVARDAQHVPWFVGGAFGDDVKSSPSGRSYRHKANFLHIDCVEVDFDNCPLAPAEAVERFRAADLAVLVYTTPTHGLPGRGNRFRGFLPCSRSLPPADRARFVARVNGVMDGLADDASFSLSQGFRAGSVRGRPIETWLIDGRPIDEAADLDAGARWKTGTKSTADGPGPVDEESLLEAIRTGERFHPSAITLAGKWATQGVPYVEALQRLRAAFNAVPEDDRDARWRERFRKLPDVLAHVYGNQAAGEDADRERQHDAFDDDWTQRLHAANDDELDAMAADLVGEAKPEPEDAPADERGFRLLAPDDCERHTPDTPVVKGLIAERNVVLVTGDAGVGKSVLISYLAYAVSQGRSVFGRRVRKGGVLYVAAEAEGNMIGRVRALRREYGDAPDFRLVVGAGGLRRKSTGLKALKAAIIERRPKLVVIDTLAAAFPGIEENTSEGMGEAVAVFRQLAAFGPAVLVAHHTTKAGGVERGHSSLAGDVDATVVLTRGEGVVTGKTGKNRNEVSHQHVVAYVNQPFTLGLDEDGDPITTVICKETDAPEREDRPPPRAMAALSILCGLFRASGEGVTREAWRDACVASRAMAESEKDTAHRQGFKRAVDALVGGKHVEQRDGLFFPTDIRREESFTDNAAESDDDALI